MNPAAQAIMTWALTIVTILLVAGITYIYTNRNTRLTLIFTLLSVFSVLLIKIIGIVHIELHKHFMGQFDATNLPYITSGPGWSLLLHAWHIWILPVLFIFLLAITIIYFIVTSKKDVQPKVEVRPAIRSAYTMTHAERLNTMMAMDAAKKESREVNEKLSEALLTNAAYEIKISDLTTTLKQLEKDLADTQKRLSEEIETLELELSAKNKENEYISNQLSERSRELIRAQEMFEKLAALHRKTQL